MKQKIKDEIKELKKEIERITKHYIKDKWIRPNTWELFYPDGTSSLMNFNPIEFERQKTLKEFSEFLEHLISVSERTEEFDKLILNKLEEIKELENE